MVLAGFVFFWQLNSSSLYIDETLSLDAARGGLGHLVWLLRHLEENPPGYSLFINAWVGVTGSRAEWIARLPSTLAALTLVLVVWRLGDLFAGRVAGLTAALLAAVSPLVLEYAQQARAYSMLMLAVAVSVLAAFEAERRDSERWLVVSCLAGVAALWLHYTALLIVGPLCLWLVFGTGFERRTKVAYCAILAASWLVLIPLIVEQYIEHPAGATGAPNGAPIGFLSLGHAIRVGGAVFDTRYTSHAGVAQVLGAGVTVAAVAVVAVALRRRRRSDQELVLLLALVAPTVTLLGAILSKDVLISRYATVSVPFMLVVIGGAVAMSRRTVAVALMTAALTAAVIGTVGSHRVQAFNINMRAATKMISNRWKPGDVVLDGTSISGDFTFAYYSHDELPRSAPIVDLGSPRIRQYVHAGCRLWIMTLASAQSRAALPVPRSYKTILTQDYKGIESLEVKLAQARPGQSRDPAATCR